MINPKILLKAPALLVAAAIWVLSSRSTLPPLEGVLGFDKFQHATTYLALAVTIALWFSPAQWRSYRLRTFLLIVLISSLYGAIDEVHQFYVPNRDCNVGDWAADTLGSLLGATAALLVGRRTDGGE
ncbi:antibiotic resistance protein VanZ [Spirochaetia bacterium]|nr:antibiotic resistance protein VanZ [Spirochaetia bacterium]